MKEKGITFIVGFIGMGLFYGVLLYFFGSASSTGEVIQGAIFFGLMWGLAEVFVFPWIRKKFKKK
ncbi:hypothetical protein [Flavobacterium tegetincola]|uniref:hypothetical protein n=1 Tax=Flavobacterium tegetincola TaxID=150172 RepID=UPI000416EA08|nr:hypothetical protein [Flavobacterium tegetincola]